MLVFMLKRGTLLPLITVFVVAAMARLWLRVAGADRQTDRQMPPTPGTASAGAPGEQRRVQAGDSGQPSNLPSSADGVTWCNDAVNGSTYGCDQQYVRIRGCGTYARGLACHETGHAIGQHQLRLPGGTSRAHYPLLASARLSRARALAMASWGSR